MGGIFSCYVILSPGESRLFHEGVIEVFIADCCLKKVVSFTNYIFIEYAEFLLCIASLVPELDLPLLTGIPKMLCNAIAHNKIYLAKKLPDTDAGQLSGFSPKLFLGDDPMVKISSPPFNKVV